MANPTPTEPGKQTESFTCLIEDHKSDDRFSAKVSVTKRLPIRLTRLKDQVALADIYIAPISNQLFIYGSKANSSKEPARFNVPTKETTGVHDHFVLYDFNGWGLYIVRDNRRREVRRRECSIWDLGDVFGRKVMAALKRFS